MRTRPHAFAAVAALAALALAAPAGASNSQPTIVQDDSQIVYGGADKRTQRLDELKALGVDIVKIRIDWRYLAPEGQSKPSGFSGEDPNQYPADRWAPYDEAIKGIVARGMTPYVMLGGRGPDWATGDGLTNPNADEFKRFVQAVGTRYSGNFGATSGAPGGGGGGGLPLPAQAKPVADAAQTAISTAGLQAAQAGTPALPRVATYSVWNEPGLSSWLKPQYDKKGRPQSPRIYRGLVYAARDALAATGHGSDQLLIGELAPSAGTSTTKVRPLTFLRELACVDSKYKAYTGSAAKARGCDGFAALPGTGLAYHPYTLSGGPDVHSRTRDEAHIAELSRVTSVLDRLYNAKRLQAKRMPVWISEFGFQTDPPDEFAGSSIKKVPAFMGQSEWLAWRNGRVAAYSQYPLVDDNWEPGKYGGFQSGIRDKSGNPKPAVYAAFERPFFVQLRGSKTVELFGAVRAGAPGQDVTIEQRSGGKGSFKALVTVKLGAQGYFRLVRNISVPTKRQFRFRAGDQTSRTATAHR
jgi:hypothetical protein